MDLTDSGMAVLQREVRNNGREGRWTVFLLRLPGAVFFFFTIIFSLSFRARCAFDVTVMLNIDCGDCRLSSIHRRDAETQKQCTTACGEA